MSLSQRIAVARSKPVFCKAGWQCKECGDGNSSFATTCAHCGAQKPKKEEVRNG